MVKPAAAADKPRPPRTGPAAKLLVELDEHNCDGICTDYRQGSGSGTRKCPVAASLRILLFRMADKHGLTAIPKDLRLWVVGPNQRRHVNGRWVYNDGPNGIFWREKG